VKFVPTALPGVVLVEMQPMEDERGFFARTFCRDEFRARGLCDDFPQCSISFNQKRATLRGMHYQESPHAEVKLVRCTQGSIHDVIVDLRPGSPTLRQWVAVELSAANRRALYIPEGLAHGFLTLQDETEVSYQISRPHRPEAARGVRYDDPAFGIRWPSPPAVIAERDRSYPDHALQRPA